MSAAVLCLQKWGRIAYRLAKNKKSDNDDKALRRPSFEPIVQKLHIGEQLKVKPVQV